MLESLQNYLINFISGPGGYAGLFVFGALATTMLPMSPELAALAAWAFGMNPVLVIMFLSVGNFLGNALNYWIGFYGMTWVIEKYFKINQKQLRKSKLLFEKYGPPILLFSWVPFVGDPITFIPGIIKYSFLKFTIYVFIGKIIRYIGLWYLIGKWVS
jgi:membrane protein YqaA with SNARE-associated domain